MKCETEDFLRVMPQIWQPHGLSAGLGRAGGKMLCTPAGVEGRFAQAFNLICSLPCLISVLCCCLFWCRLWAGCGTKASVASRVEQPAQRRQGLPPVVVFDRWPSPDLNTA
jgi:hypothetical protein